MSGHKKSPWERIKTGLGVGKGDGAGPSRRRGRAPTALPDHATQYPGAERREPATITVGFDWGTSCTKVVLRDSYGQDSPSYLVDFGDLGHGEHPFLLPSRLFLDRDGHAGLRATPGAFEIPDVKLLLIQGPGRPVGGEALGAPPPLSHEAAALYVAAALRHARTWFLREHAQAYRQFAIDWELNLGIPAANYDERALCGAFREVARVGWRLSVQEGPLLLARAREGFERAAQPGFDAGLGDHAVNVIPEVAAQVVAYARSSLRTTGLHVLVDVGAATLDVAGFILHEREGSDRYSILEAMVVQKGAFRLHEARVRAVTSSVATWGRPRPAKWGAWCGELGAACTPMVNVPYGMRDYYPAPLRLSVKPPPEPDHSYAEDCRRTIHKVLHNIRKHRDPNSPAWAMGLPVFVCGGGQRVSPYKKGLVALNGWWQQHTPVAPFDMMGLPKPDNLLSNGLEDRDYHRISVAYGLSHPAYDIGEVRPPSVIDDIRIPPPRQREYRYEDSKDWT